MAAPISLSTHFSSFSSSRPIHFLALQKVSIQPSSNPAKLNSILHLSSFPLLSLSQRNGNLRNIARGQNSERCALVKPSVSGHHESQPHQSNEVEGNESPLIESFSLKTLMKAYKEAVLYGDQKTVYELENIMLLVEKDKNELGEKVSTLCAEISSGKEKYIRLQADFDNYRKRSEKEKLNVRSNAEGEVIESLLPMIDSFERAKQHLKLETEMEKKIDTSYQGIYKQFVEIMRSLRVAVVPTVGKPFDPSKHEAIAREESNEHKEGIITQEIRRGFYLGDRLLRPALVKVSCGPPKIKPQSFTASVAGFEP